MPLTTETQPPARPAATNQAHGRRLNLAAVVAVLTGAVALMLLAFLTPAVNSGAEDLPLAVSGPAPVVSQVAAALEGRAPGTFEITTYPSAEEAASAVTRREAIGGLAIGADGVTVQLASGAGTPYASLLRSVGAGLAADGQRVTYADLAPLTADDPAGVGISAIALPMVFGGMASAMLLAAVLKAGRARRIAGALAVAVAAGLTAAAILQYGFAAVDGDFWLTAASISLGIAAVSLTVLGLESLLGFAGLGLGAALMMFVSNPLSGMATGPQWLPQPWGEIGQYLPLGAAGTAVRSSAFFDGAGMGRAVVVLVCWAALGALLVLLSRRRGQGAGSTAEPVPA